MTDGLTEAAERFPNLAALGMKKKERRQPSKAARQRVRDAFDANMLADVCIRQDFSNYAPRTDLAPSKTGRERFYYYKDNGSDILAVAHLDSVQEDGICEVVDSAAGLLAVCATLDDRLGAYVILELLPKLGITCDWLLTTDEEIGASTADAFVTDKDYNWMFQFDRGGTDVVLYDYETPELVELVEASGARVGIGSFSDICTLEFLGCAGINWGVGYEDYHGPRAHAWLEDTFRMVARFVKFHKFNAKTTLVHQRADRWPSDAWASADKWTYDEWWAKKDGVMVGDCGHAVDLDDPATYIEDADYINCTACGTIDPGQWSAL